MIIIIINNIIIIIFIIQFITNKKKNSSRMVLEKPGHMILAVKLSITICSSREYTEIRYTVLTTNTLNKQENKN